MDGGKDALRDVSFDGKPSGYRDFRRKTLLAIAGLEDKHAHLAGPRLLSRLSGEAWRATEHLNISQLRSPDGFMVVIKALDEHYKFLPETELHESIDEFLFALKRRQGEGATAFASRFRTQLARVETLISQEREMTRSKRRRATEKPGDIPPVDELYESELEETASEGAGTEHPAEPARPEAEPTSGTADASEAAPPAAEPGQPARGPGTASVTSSNRSRKKQHSSYGSYEKDWTKAQAKMQQMLGTLEMGHVKPKPIFPQSVLGHLFMRKYGLSREQRAQVVRSTNGSSRFIDVERILRASDLEESHKSEDRRPQRPSRREAYAVQEHVHAVEQSDSSSLAAVDTDDSMSNDDVMAVDQMDSSEEEFQNELQEVYELQRKSKEKFRKSFKTYKDTKKRVKELKRSRQPYYPVVALTQPQDQSQPSQSSQNQAPLQKSNFKYDKKSSSKPYVKGKKDGGRPSKKEEANMTESVLVSSFAYMAEASPSFATAANTWTSEEVLLASIPEGHANLDTGCTTSVIGSDTAAKFQEFLRRRNLPQPAECDLPPVELKGFQGGKVETTTGLRWHVKLGSLWGSVTTYVVPGQTPFLLSRRVLEGMKAKLDLGQKSITSEHHGMFNVPLRQAANGHFLMPLYEIPNDFHVEESQLAESMIRADAQPCQPEYEPNDAEAAETPTPSEPLQSPGPSEDQCVVEIKRDKGKPTKNGKITTGDRRRAFQHIAKNTKNGIVDVQKFQEEFKIIYGNSGLEVSHAMIAYKPKLERVPTELADGEIQQSILTLTREGEFSVSPWSIRPAGSTRCRVPHVSRAMFAYRPVTSEMSAQPKATRSADRNAEPCCYCCNEVEHDHGTHDNGDNGKDDLEMLYEEMDWLDINTEPIPKETQEMLLASMTSLRRTQAQLVMTRVHEEPEAVRRELSEWLGPQSTALDQNVQFLEVFTGKAPLAKRVEEKLQVPSIRIGLEYGHNLDQLKDRRMLMTLIAYVRPRHVWFSFPCGCWGPWSRFNMSKGGSCREKIVAQRAKARRHLHAVTEAWALQTALGGHCHCENPLTSEAWGELCLGEVYDIRVDQCALGLRCPKTRLPVLKPTRLVTSQRSFAEGMQQYRCDHRHQHGHLEGKYKGRNLSSIAETYPTKFCNVVSELIVQDVQQNDMPPASTQEYVYALDDDELAEDMPVEAPAGDAQKQQVEKTARAKQIVMKLHINTGHASPEQMMRLANRCHSSDTVKDAIRHFKCSVCEELKLPTLRRSATMPHADQPNQIVGVDYVQVELKRDEENGDMVERKFNVLTCVCLGTDFCQQIVVPGFGQDNLSKAFHAVWTRPYGAPKTVYMDPQQTNLSKDFQAYLRHYGINLLHCAADSHWQIGRVEIANRVLRDMARRTWRTTSRPVEEVIEACSSVRNQLLRKSGFSPAQWFLGQDTRHAGWLIDVEAQENPAVQSQIITDPSFQAKMHLREDAARAFLEAHAKDVWRRAIASRNRPLRGPYMVGQLVYMFRRRGKGQLTTRNGFWNGPGRVIGVESSTGHHVPRIVWVSWNGFIYKCSPEGLRPVPEDESEFRRLAKQLSEGRLHPEAEAAEQNLREKAGQFHDLTQELPPDDNDFELEDDVQEEPDDDDMGGDDNNDDDDDNPPRRKSTKRPN